MASMVDRSAIRILSQAQQAGSRSDGKLDIEGASQRALGMLNTALHEISTGGTISRSERQNLRHTLYVLAQGETAQGHTKLTNTYYSPNPKTPPLVLPSRLGMIQEVIRDINAGKKYAPIIGKVDEVGEQNTSQLADLRNELRRGLVSKHSLRGSSYKSPTH